MLIFVATTTAQAAVIDFSGFTTGDTGLSSLTVGDATFDIAGGTVFTYAPGAFGGFTDNGGLCALSSSNCETDFTVTFAFAVTNVSFEAAFFNPVDVVQVEAFNGMTSVGLIDVLADGSFSFGGAVLTSLSFVDSSTGAGYGFGDFSYDRAQASAPVPGTVALLGLGAFGLAFRRRRAG